MSSKVDLQRERSYWHMNDRIHQDLYACADYYIMTSKYEGGMPPLTLAEAMASGLPCIVSDIPNLAVVKDADCGIVVASDDIAQAGDKVLEYLKKEYSNQARNARAYAVKHLDWALIAEIYLGFFREII